MPLPNELLQAVAAPGGGQIVLVIGAGASYEPPMSIPMARECSERAYEQLVDDAIMNENECSDPTDLSCLADAVYDKTQEQTALVERMPRDKFRAADPNIGCLIAAALMREQAVRGVLTLNFDRGMINALSRVGAVSDVAVVRGPHDHQQMSVINLIYLHAEVEADPEDWVLRTETMENAWRDAWQEVVTQMMVGGPCTVFAGLGTPATVLVETTTRIRSALPNEPLVFQVDPSDPEKAPMKEALELNPGQYLQLGWNTFMEELGSRLATRHKRELKEHCEILKSNENFNTGDPQEICERIASHQLVGTGEMRARWLLETSQRYLPRFGLDLALVAKLVLGIQIIEDQTGTTAEIYDDGVVEFVKDGRVMGSVIAASGRGNRNWTSMEAAISQNPFGRARRVTPPRFGLLAGVEGERPEPEEIAPPEFLLDGQDGDDSILGGDGALRLVSVEELRESPERALEIIA